MVAQILRWNARPSRFSRGIWLERPGREDTRHAEHSSLSLRQENVATQNFFSHGWKQSSRFWDGQHHHVPKSIVSSLIRLLFPSSFVSHLQSPQCIWESIMLYAGEAGTPQSSPGIPMRKQQCAPSPLHSIKTHFNARIPYSWYPHPWLSPWPAVHSSTPYVHFQYGFPQCPRTCR